MTMTLAAILVTYYRVRAKNAAKASRLPHFFSSKNRLMDRDNYIVDHPSVAALALIMSCEYQWGQ